MVELRRFEEPRHVMAGLTVSPASTLAGSLHFAFLVGFFLMVIPAFAGTGLPLRKQGAQSDGSPLQLPSQNGAAGQTPIPKETEQRRTRTELLNELSLRAAQSGP